MIGRERALEKALLRCATYDFIMIDTPPSLGLLTINAFVAATGVIVPGPDRVPVAARPRPAREHAAMVRENLNPDVKIVGILPTMYDRRTALARGRRDPAGELRRPRLQDAHPQDDPVRGGAREGVVRARIRPEGEAAELYRDLAKEVLNGAKSRKHA